MTACQVGCGGEEDEVGEEEDCRRMSRMKRAKKVEDE